MKNKFSDIIFTVGVCGCVLATTFYSWHCMAKGLNRIPVEPVQKIETRIEIPMCEIEEAKFIPYFELSDNERYIVESIVAGESGHEPLLGKMAVAQCILNACNRDEIQPSEVKTKYQYSGWKDIDKFEINYPEMAEEVKHAVWAVFDNGEVVTQDNILWFYSPNYSKGLFHNTQKFSLEIGGHRFYSPWE